MAGQGKDSYRQPVKLPVGIENFEKLRTEGFYYVDKTGLIRDLLRDWGEVNLFTRPRRFGKSLNMSMLKHFFEYGCDASLFEGLEIAKETELCKEYMGKFPVISITLKGVVARNFEDARGMLCSVIGNEALRFQFLMKSEQLTAKEKEQYTRLITIGKGEQPGFLMSQDVLEGSIKTLCQLLYKHYGQKAILLIDEYDVPLDKAERAGYYEEMASLIRGLLGQALKTNDSLFLAVLTGCLRVAKETIFTGLNNFKVYSITDATFGEYFGFLDCEVRDMLEFYGLGGKYAQTKEWYDGYCFGEMDVYCPWDVINYCKELRYDPDTPPRAYWINTSGNDIIRTFLQMAKPGIRRELERLVNGETVTKKIRQELTYRELYDNVENVWSVMFMTGYLTQRGRVESNTYADTYELAIPNQEIRQIFVEQVMEWFQGEIGKEPELLDAFCEAFRQGDAEAIEQHFTSYLKKTISIRDTAVRKSRKENFYHGILLGLLSHRGDWYVRSNVEAGDGYSDIVVEMEAEEIGVIIEVKYPDGGDLEAGCKEALEQIEKKHYYEALDLDGIGKIILVGIACERKRCKVITKVEKMQDNLREGTRVEGGNTL